jgi:hypothetical protein
VEKRDAVFFSASGVQGKEGRAATSIRAFKMLLQVQAAGNWEEQIYLAELGQVYYFFRIFCLTGS